MTTTTNRTMTLIDPVEAVIFGLAYVDSEYRKQQFTGHEWLVSPGFPKLKLSAAQILEAGL